MKLMKAAHRLLVWSRPIAAQRPTTAVALVYPDIPTMAISDDEVSIVVENALGQIVFESSVKVSSSHFQKEIDLSAVANGIYFIEIRTTDKFLRKKILRKKILIAN